VGKETRTGSILVIDDERKATELVELIDEFGLKRLRTVDRHPVNRINEDTFDILNWDTKSRLRDTTRVRRT
jgi:hypothetical protein